MTQLPQRQSLVAQTFAILKEQIQSGTWDRWLPREWDLCEQLKISRRTLRGALAQLEHEGLVKAGRGRRREISTPKRKASRQPPSNSVILLNSQPVSDKSSFTILWMDDLREHLAAAGYHLEVHFHRDRPGRKPSAALEQLVRDTRPAAWLLGSQTAQVQQWFSQRGLPCVIIGSRHEGVSLPSVDIDFRALGRHAAGLLLAKGCTRLILVDTPSGLAGDLECERGFKEAAARFQHRGEAIIGHHDGTVEGLSGRLKMFFQRRRPRTGLVVTGSNYVLMTLCFLLRQGLRVPEDVALISRDDDVFMQYTIPTIAHYSAGPTVLARKVSRVFLQLVRFGVSEQRDYRVMPRFVAGESLG